MRVAAERSLSSILRATLLTTLINNEVSGKVNARGVPESFARVSRDAVDVLASDNLGPKAVVRICIPGPPLLTKIDTGRSCDP